MVQEILFAQPGIEPVPPALKAWNLNHWITREIPILIVNLSVSPLIRISFL